MKRKPLSAKNVKGAVIDALFLPRRRVCPEYNVLRPCGGYPEPNTTNSRFLIRTEAICGAVLHYFDRTAFFHMPDQQKANIYIPHIDAEQDINEKKIPWQKGPFFTVDLRGLGESLARTCGAKEFLTPYDTDFTYAMAGQMLGQPYLGRRVLDLLATLDVLQDNGCREAVLYGRGLGSIPAAFATLLHPLVKRVTLENALLSYHELTQVPVYSWPRSVFVQNILASVDLPDVYRVLEKKHLRIINPWDHDFRRWKKDRLKKHLKELGIPARTVVLKRF